MSKTIRRPIDVDLLPDPPRAAKRPKTNEVHGVRWNDDYAWLRDEGYPTVDNAEILEYLRAENTYFEAAMAPVQALVRTLFDELKGRLKEDDRSVPVKDGEWLYHWSFDQGAQYRRWYRTPVTGGEAQLILDEPGRAQGREFYRLGGFEVSEDGRLLAWAEDIDGSERFTLHIKDLETGRVLADSIPETIGSPVWSADGASLLYRRVSAEWRPYQVRLHRLGDSPANDRVLYEENDTSFFVSLGKTQSREFIVIGAGDHVTTESYLVPSAAVTRAPLLVAQRKTGHQYTVDHANDTFFIRTNDTHENFRVATAPEDSPQPEHWTELVAGSDAVYIRGLTSFKDVLVLQERVDGLDQIRIRTSEGDEHRIEFPESTYATGLGSNPEFQTSKLRLAYQSMVTPATVYDYDMATRTLRVRKVMEIPSGYDASNYATERLMAEARDGTRVPVSIVYSKDFRFGGDAPLHLYGYGAYGMGMSPSFSSARLSLLDRGFVYAIAHIRGGDEMGYGWYTAGKLKNRTNTFNDFVDVAKFLVRKGYAQAGQITASGGSAGGELMGAVANQAPELFSGIVAHVPFVDVLNTMLDASLPLTPMEWPEWGNPIEDKEAFEFIRSYCPYENVEPKNYPPLLVTGGLNDPRVTYWEPAKWVAKLRATKTDDHLLLLKINMGAGHAGKSGRYEQLQETAEEFAFLLMVTGRADG